MPRKFSKALGPRCRDESLLGGYKQCPVGMGSRSCHREACSWGGLPRAPSTLAPDWGLFLPASSL